MYLHRLHMCVCELVPAFLISGKGAVQAAKIECFEGYVVREYTNAPIVACSLRPEIF